MAQNITPYGLQAQGQNKNDEWEKYLNQAKLAMAMDGETALGLAIGKGLRELWMQHLARRHARNDLKEKNAEAAQKRHDQNVANGYDLESWAKNTGLGTIGGYEGNVPIKATGGDAATPSPANYGTEEWDKYATLGGYSRNSGVPNDQNNPAFGISVEEVLRSYPDPRKDFLNYNFNWLGR